MLKIYNTLTRTLEEFKPLEKGKVKFYHCGPTVYWMQHIGNLRGMVMADLIRRSLEYLGYDVNFVRNYTDVGHLTGDNLGDADTGEDKMEKGARREGKSPKEIAEKYITIFEKDSKALNILEPDFKPRATEYIKQMQEMIKVLLDKGFAYVTHKAIYFDVSKFPNYNQLNKQKLSFNKIGAGVGEVVDSNKKNSEDFALWFFKTGIHKNALQTWDSPFFSPEVKNGEGFPGWHIECSAMCKALLGDTIDIHMGGVEHISVHHTNEIAQSEAANGVKFVNYWLHNEHLMVDGAKMAKSEGTGYSLKEVVEKTGWTRDGAGMVLRYLFLNSHYRSKQNFTWEALNSAWITSGKITDKMKEYRKIYEIDKKVKIIKGCKDEFIKALKDDFNVPQALAVMWDLIRSSENKVDKYVTILDFDKVLGLGLKESQNIARKILEPKHISNIKVRNLIKDRDEARANKNYRRADDLRQEIEAEGYRVSDKAERTEVIKI